MIYILYFVSDNILNFGDVILNLSLLSYSLPFIVISMVVKQRSSIGKEEESNEVKTKSHQKYNFEDAFSEIRKKIKSVDPINIESKTKLNYERTPIQKTPKSYLKDTLPPPKASTAYKRYSSVYPVTNNLLAKKWEDNRWEKHRDKITTMKACIDNENTRKESKARQMQRNVAKQSINKLNSARKEYLNRKRNIIESNGPNFYDSFSIYEF